MAKIPAMTLSGGKLSDFGGFKAAREFRLWVHPKRGDDYYYASKSFDSLITRGKAMKRRGMRVEQPLAVVWDKKYRKYREVVIDKKSLGMK